MRRSPRLREIPFDPVRPFRVGKYRVAPVPVSHPVESVGYLLSDARATVAFSGDTGPTTRLKKREHRGRLWH